MTKDCPLCFAGPSQIEHLTTGERFCNGCGRLFELDEHGTYLRSVPTNHSPTRPPFNKVRVTGSGRGR